MVYTKQLDRDQQVFGSPTGRKNVAAQFGSPKNVAGQLGIPKNVAGQFGSPKNVAGQLGIPKNVAGQFGSSPKNVAGQFGSPNDNDIRQRKISHNFMHEQRLLDALDMIAVIPVP